MSCRKLRVLRDELSRINQGMKMSTHKIYKPHDLLQYTFKKWPGKVAISCSFGRCSIVLLHMALQYDKNVPVLFANTGVEFPETIKYKKQIVQEWNLNYYEGKPETTFWECVEKHGWPHIRDRRGPPRCCYHLKKKPLKKLYKQTDCNVIVDGLRAGESSQRMLSLSQLGQVYYSKLQQLWKIHPIAWIDYTAIENYIRDYNIPENPVYAKGQFRSGCWPCTAYLSWIEELSVSHPRLYRIVQNKMGQKLIEQFA